MIICVYMHRYVYIYICVYVYMYNLHVYIHIHIYIYTTYRILVPLHAHDGGFAILLSVAAMHRCMYKNKHKRGSACVFCVLRMYIERVNMYTYTYLCISIQIHFACILKEIEGQVSSFLWLG